MFEIQVQEEYVNLVNDLYKAAVILIVTHIVLSCHYDGQKSAKLGLCGSLFNESFTITMGALFLCILSYELVFKRLIVFT